MLIAIDQEIVEKLIRTLEATQIELARARALPPVENDDPVGTQAAADYLGITKAAVYQNQDKIPHRKRHGKLYFFKSELREYIETGTH